MNLNSLTADEQKQLKEYLQSIKEIKKEVNQLLSKGGYALAEDGMSSAVKTKNHSSGLMMPLEGDSLDMDDFSGMEDPTAPKSEYKKVCDTKQQAYGFVDKLHSIGADVNIKRVSDDKYLITFSI